jgi:outer membrane protein assembly factor BamB
MSAISIKDGSTGYVAEVDSSNRLQTYAVTINENNQANSKGRAYNINTDDITLTDAVETPILYIKNNEDKDLHITALDLWAGTSTGGTATLGTKWVVERNPTAGTIISNATAVDIESNRNFGSNNTLLVDSYKGATGNTMTGGTDHLVFRGTLLSRIYVEIDEIIPKGSSIGIHVKPPTSNTSLIVYAAAICHLEA